MDNLTLPYGFPALPISIPKIIAMKIRIPSTKKGNCEVFMRMLLRVQITQSKLHHLKYLLVNSLAPISKDIRLTIYTHTL
jgi:hypothetical protein